MCLYEYTHNIFTTFMVKNSLMHRRCTKLLTVISRIKRLCTSYSLLLKSYCKNRRNETMKTRNNNLRQYITIFNIITYNFSKNLFNFIFSSSSKRVELFYKNSLSLIRKKKIVKKTYFS